MQLIHKDLKKGIAKIKIENKDDIWYLSTLVEEGDIVRSRTERKIKIGGGGEDRKANVKIIHVTLSIKLEKIEFHKYTGDLRISGKIIEGLEDVPAGSYHTFNIEEGTILTLEKPAWLGYHVKRLKEAMEDKPSNILICVFDREEAMFALMKKYGYDVLAEIKGDVQKKAVDEKVKANFYSEIIKLLESFDAKYKFTKIILASPSFWKEELSKELTNESLKRKILFATSNSVSKSAINEVLKRPEVSTAIKQDRVIREIGLVEEVLGEIKKNGLVAYGIKETKEASEMGAIKVLLISDGVILKKREDGTIGEVERIMREADSTQADVYIVSSEHDGGKTLDGLGGIAALLRYRTK
ncbi:mRNA surveillance protein pelota [Candidatus Woesearchaeota archaeon]|nr:mRNA surveillance protein pelota [Candidatus Woesearchaeota archaeon]